MGNEIEDVLSYYFWEYEFHFTLHRLSSAMRSDTSSYYLSRYVLSKQFVCT